MKVKIKENCGRTFIAFGRVFLKLNEEKVYDDSNDIQILIKKGFIEEVKDEKIDSNQELFEKYEKETGKKSVWRGKVTKQFEEWAKAQ